MESIGYLLRFLAKFHMAGKMLRPLSYVLVMEIFVAFLMVSRLPALSALASAVVGLAKKGRGRVVARGIFLLVSMSFLAAVSSIQKARQQSGLKIEEVARDERFIKSIMEVFLMGNSLILALMISGMHAYLHDIEILRVQLGVLKKYSKAAGVDVINDQVPPHLQSKEAIIVTAETTFLNKAIADLRLKLEDMKIETKKKDGTIKDLEVRLEQLTLDCKSKEGKLKTAEASIIALQKQAEGFLLEYDRLSEDNESLRNQLAYFDRKYSNSDGKKRA